VQKSGAWFSYGDVRLGQGRENAKNFLRESPDLAKEIEQRVRAALTVHAWAAGVGVAAASATRATTSGL
jgi:recombination protein RecA